MGGNITMAESGGSPIIEASEVALTGNTKDTVKSNVFKQMLENPSIENIGNAAVEGAKKLGKAIFYDKDGNLDKNVLLGTIAFTASYAEAKSLANDVGVDLTEAEYDEATKAEKKAEYAANLQNFYAGKNEGGRIGFENGGIDMMALEKSVMENPEMVNEITNIEFGVAEPGEPTDQGSFIRFDKEKEEAEMLKEILRELEADGGRIGYNQGGDTETRIDLMGDLSKEDLKLYSKLRRDVFSKIFDDQEGYAQTYFEVLNPFDDKPADTRSSQVRASSFDKAMKILIPGIISTKNDPKARRDFIERFTENYNLNIPGVENQYLKNGGRIGLREGTGGKKKYGMGIESAVKQIDPLQKGFGDLKAMGGGLPLAFTRLEKSFLFKHLAKLGGADRSFTMPQLYRILSDPSKFPKDAMALKEFFKN